MRASRLTFMTLSALMAVCLPSAAVTIHVPEDQPTIQAGIDAASSGDTVLVASGTYYEHAIQLRPLVTLLSESGPQATIIDAQYAGDGVIGADGAIVAGFTIKSSGGLNSAGVSCYETTMQILDNIVADHQRTAIWVRYSASEIRGNEIHVDPVVHFASDGIRTWGGSPVIIENSIYATDPNGNSDAIYLGYPSSDEPPGTLVQSNILYGRVWISGGGATGPTQVRENLIVIENGFSSAINIASSYDQTLVSNNTLIGGGGLYVQGGSVVDVTDNVIAYANVGIQVWSGDVSLSCNDLWENGTDYMYIEPGPDDFSDDPLFCLDENLDEPYTLHEGSPCLPENSPCGELVGAFGIGCDPVTPVEDASWGAIKAMYR